MITLSQMWPMESPSSSFLCYFDMFLLFFKHFLTSWHNKLFQFFPWPNLEFCHFSTEPWFLLVENAVYRNKDLGSRYAHCYWGEIASRPSQSREVENVSTYTCTHTHNSHIILYPCTSIPFTYIRMYYMHTCMYLCMYNVLEPVSSHVYLQFQSNTAVFILSFPFTIMVAPFSKSAKPEPIIRNLFVQS